jgi:ribonuclease G
MPNELLVSRLGGRVATALREDGEVVELRVEEGGDDLAVGDVLKGRVSKILPGIQAAFVDVGAGPDAFLHAADLQLPEEAPPEVGSVDAEDPEPEDELEVIKKPRRASRPGPPLQDRLKEGREIVVQVARESLGSKGPRVTSFVTLAGRHLVFAPHVPFRGVSRRVVEQDERDRLRAIARGLAPAGAGFIVRTAGRGAPEASFQADAAWLAATWREIERRASRTAAPARLHADAGLFLRSLRDAPRVGLDAVVIEDPELFETGRAYLADLDPALAGRLRLHEGPVPLFDEQGIHAEIERALHPRVWLRSGGTVVIEPTEALVSIDVNTGKNVGVARPEETILKTNLEAAREIARQLRLRDLGGIIVVDFIDMEAADHRRQVVDALTAALQRDHARTKVLGLSELGLLQLTRKRTRPELRSSLMRPCPSCSGEGGVKTPELSAHEALLEVRRLLAGLDPAGVRVRAHPDVAREIRRAVQSPGEMRDGAWVDRLVIEEASDLDPDRFDVTAG